MPYARRYRKARKPAATNRKIATRRPTANTQKYQILSLNQKINRLAKKQSNITEKVYYQKAWDQTVSANYAVHPLVTPGSWTNVFGQSDNVTESRKLSISSLYIDQDLTPHTEHAEVDYTIFLVTPKNNKVMRETNAMTSFTSSNGQLDYSVNSGIVFMNPKRFNIHKVWRAKTAAQYNLINSSTQLLSSSVVKSWRRTHSMSFKKQLRNATGVWTDIADNEVPVGAALTLIAFNNNSAADIENPAWKGTVHFTCYC